MSSEAFNNGNYQAQMKYPQHMQHRYHQSQYVNQIAIEPRNTNNTYQQPVQNPIQPTQSSSSVYLALLGLAESFQQKQQYRLVIHCLESILTIKNYEVPIVTSFYIQLKTRINLCRLYLKHTMNNNQYVNAHVEKSIILIKNLNFNDEFRYEATYLIYKIFKLQKMSHTELKQNSVNGPKIEPNEVLSLFGIELIQQALEASTTTYPVWHLRLLFLIADILTYDKDYNAAAHFMSIGINYCIKNQVSTYTHIMFILCKGLIHLLQHNPSELQTTMQPCASLIESFTSATIYQTESLKIFFLVLQVTYFLQCGQMKSVKNTLKSLQHYVQSFVCRAETEVDQTSKNPMESFQWLHKDHLGILVYLLTVIHSMQTGVYEKAQKFSEKALLNIQRLKLKEKEVVSNKLSIKNPCVLTSYCSDYVTNTFHFMFLENIIRCNISIGNRCSAARNLGDIFQVCQVEIRLMNSFSPQLHCLVGLYALSVNLKEQAMTHFNISLKNTNDTDLWLYNAMNLALCYLESIKTNPNNQNQLLSIMDNLLPEKITTKSTSLTSFSHYFRALRYFLNKNYSQAKESLKESILLSNSEELSNITANSYVFMGHIDMLSNSYQESFEMITNGLDISEKMPDALLRSYSNYLLKEIFKVFNDNRESETMAKYNDLEKKQNDDKIEASKMPQHILIDWNTNSLPTNMLISIQKQSKDLKLSTTQYSGQVTPPQHNSPQQQQVNNQHQTEHNSPHQQNQMQYQIQQVNVKQQISPQQQKHQYTAPHNQRQHISPQQYISPQHQNQQRPIHPQYQQQYHIQQPQLQQNVVNPQYQYQQQHNYIQQNQQQINQQQQQYQMQQQMLRQQQQQHQHQQQLLMSQNQMQQNNRQL